MASRSARRPEPRPGNARPGRVLAIDYGRKRLGLAVSDETQTLARPLRTLERKNRAADLKRLREIAREQQARRIVVGHPLRVDATRGAMAAEAERFAKRVGKHLGLPVELVDERLTSWEAEHILEEERRAGRKAADSPEKNKKKKNAKKSGDTVDAVAAAVILRDYLQRANQEPG